MSFNADVIRENLAQESNFELGNRIVNAVYDVSLAGQLDGEHHKTWTIDQMVRVLLGDQYEEFIRQYNKPEDEWDWDVGIAP